MINKFSTAAWEGDVAMLNVLLKEYDKSIVNEINKRGQTALYCAARQGQEEVVKILMKCPTIQMNVKMPGHGGTALHGMPLYSIIFFSITHSHHFILPPFFLSSSPLSLPLPSFLPLLLPSFSPLPAHSNECKNARHLLSYIYSSHVLLIFLYPSLRPPHALFLRFCLSYTRSSRKAFHFFFLVFRTKLFLDFLIFFLAACFGGHAYVVSYLLYWGANFSIENVSGLTARQEAKGQAIDVFAYHENGKGDEKIVEICERAKIDVCTFFPSIFFSPFFFNERSGDVLILCSNEMIERRN